MKSKILGLDTGTNSLGWAVVERDEENNYKLLKHGDVIFTEGVKIEKEIEKSRAAERTGYRALRKQYFRRRLRKIEVLKVLVRYDLCPHLSKEELNLWHTKKIYPQNDDFMLWQRTSDDENKNPYRYRYLCLNEKLDLSVPDDRFILGRALYHISQRRGFLSNRLDASEENSEDGKVKQGISDLSNEMREAGCEYLGEYFFKLYESARPVRIRCRYTAREEHYRREFDAICRRQELEPELIDALVRAIFFQRPLKSQRKGVGKCTFEPGKPRCAASHPDYEEFRKLSFINNIRIKTPYEEGLRPLNDEERARIEPLFYRKSKPNFDFEEIAKALAGKNNYCWVKDDLPKDFKFNYRMTQGVPGCPTTAKLISVLGDDWRSAIAEVYNLSEKKGGLKTVDEMVDDIWNVLYFFSSENKLKDFATSHLQLDEDTARKFAKINLSGGFASLSLKAVRNILPFLKTGLRYSHAVMFAKVPDIVSRKIWNDPEQRQFIMDNLHDLITNYDPHKRDVRATIDFCIKDFLKDNFDLPAGAVDKLYHPSMIETYEDARPNARGVLQLGSPKTNAIRNPMAMRSLHMVRKVVNKLLREGIIDQNTEVHVEYARELNDANKRAAIAAYQREQEKMRKEYSAEIKKLYKEDFEPTERDILKFQMWEEQHHTCLYTGKSIAIADFLGLNPKFDIEHTIPQSIGGDSTKMNMTLCELGYNRNVKKNMLPSQMANHDEVLTRIKEWKERYEKLEKEHDKLRTHSGMAKDMKDRIIQKRHLLKMKKDYWEGKYKRFTMTEVPEEFSLRQGMGIGLISKYAGLYLKSLFHDPQNRNKSRVFIVKGPTTAEFRKMWGLQDEYAKKSRINHAHHCIDAITVACIGKYECAQMSAYYHDQEAFEQGRGGKPHFKKPWPTFTQDVLDIEKSLLVVHSTPDNMAKKSHKLVQTPQGPFIAKGDSARGSLHRDSMYGAIEHNGQIKYVIRKPLSEFKTEKELDTIVDETVRQTIKQSIAGKDFKTAIAEPIYMNPEKGIRINKVRCFAGHVKNPINIRRQRDQSDKEYKRQVHVDNDGNHLMAIYEGQDAKGKTRRNFELVRNIDAAQYYKESTDRAEYPALIPQKSPETGYPLKAVLKIGTQVLLFEESAGEIDFSRPADLVKRLYRITGLSSMTASGIKYGVLNLRHCQEARKAKDVKKKNVAFKNGAPHQPAISLYHTQFKALVEGKDFELNILGQIRPL